MNLLENSSHQNPYCSIVRTRLEFLALPEDPDIPEHKKFFPRSAIWSLFTPEVVRGLVACACQRCASLRHTAGIQLHHACKVVNAIIGTPRDRDVQKTYHLTLGLLLYIDRPALIIGFVQQKCYDGNVEAYLEQLTPAKFQQKFWPKLLSSAPQESLSVMSSFRWRKYNFFVPMLKDNEFSTYDQHTILPFINERRVGRETDDGDIVFEGAYGQIYSFEILDEYREFVGVPGVRRLVRKELRDNDHSGIFKAERANLDYVTRIKDDHLVKVVKAYKHGDVGNIIFPEAMTNLGHYLRNARFGASELQHSGIEHHPFFEQMLGMARALHKILDYEAEDESRNDILYGYHFDMKPANILVEECGQFIISDFGQAHFRKVGVTSSKVVGFGGTESYAPPEIDDPAMLQNRRYDIWSLGCIYLEIITFIILGYAGVHQLDLLRISTSADLSKTDDRFFVREGKESRLKPAIDSWMHKLPDHCETPSNKAIIHRIVALIRSMLLVNVEERCSSKQLCYELSDVLSMRHSPALDPVAPVVAVAQLDFSGVEMGSEALARSRNIKYHLRYWNSGPIKFVRLRHSLDLYTYEANKWTKTIIGDIPHLKLVPRYAMNDTGQHRYRDASLYLETTSPSDTAKLTSLKFWSKSIIDIFLLQEALTGQRISRHLEAHKVIFSLSSPTDRKMPGNCFGSKTTTPQIISDDFPAVQLWSEIPHMLAAGGDDFPHGLSKRPSYNGPSLRRVVILTSTSIHIIRIDDHIRLTNVQSESQVARSLCLVPSNKTTNAHFTSLTMSKGHGEVLPGVPLCRRSLEFVEGLKSTNLSMLRIDFKSSSETEAFREEYRKLKYRWEIEQKNFSRLQPHIGPSLGYARNTR